MDLIRRLHQAIKKDDSEALEAAVTAGADVDYVWGMQGTALCQAIATGRISTVSQLLQLGCDVNGEDFDGGFPLSMAIRKRLPDIALLLIAVPSCNVNVLDPVTKLRPLCSAVTEGLSNVVEALVQDPRCDVTLGNGIGNTALHLSLLHKQHDITQILVRCEGLRFLSNLAGHAPVHLVATLGDCSSLDLLYPASRRTEETLHHLPGVESDQCDVSSSGPVGRSGVYQRELNQRVKYTGDTALHLAVREKHYQMACRLVSLGAAVDVENNSSQTALLLACAAESMEVVERLLQEGAPPSVPGFLRLQQQRSLLATHARESSLTPLHIAASSNHLPMVKALCDFGADVNSRDERGRSVLHVALLSGAGEVAQFLLDETPQDFQCPRALGGVSLLHIVGKCRSHGARITAQLLDRGLSLAMPTRLGNLPLHEALGWENAEVVRVLLEHGADPNAPGELGAMPLTIAARMGHIHMAQMLLAAGADLNWAGPQGDNRSDCSTDKEEEEDDDEDDDLSPVAEALQAGMEDFAHYLVNAGCSLSREKYLFRPPATPSLHRFTSRSLPLNLDSIGSDDDDDDDDDDYFNEAEEEDGMPDVVRDSPELFGWLKDKARNPQSLVQQSLESVRKVFRHGDPPFAHMLCLPLPEKVIAKLFYRDNV